MRTVFAVDDQALQVPYEDENGNRLCLFCGRPVEQLNPGRKRDYCRRSCRQRAYEARKQRRRVADALGLNTPPVPSGSEITSAPRSQLSVTDLGKLTTLLEQAREGLRYASDDAKSWADLEAPRSGRDRALVKIEWETTVYRARLEALVLGLESALGMSRPHPQDSVLVRSPRP